MAESSHHDAPLTTRILQGVGIAVFMTIFRIIGGQGPGKLTFMQGLKFFGVVAIAGAAGGVAYYTTDPLRASGGARKTLANVLSLLIYCFAALAALLLAFGFPP